MSFLKKDPNGCLGNILGDYTSQLRGVFFHKPTNKERFATFLDGSREAGRKGWYFPVISTWVMFNMIGPVSSGQIITTFPAEGIPPNGGEK